MPPRRWVGYALFVAGLSFLFDTYTFLRTNWSPLHVPMYADNELALGYILAVVGVELLLAPRLIRVLDRYVPDASTNGGAALPERLPLSKKSLFVRKVTSWLAGTIGFLIGLTSIVICGTWGMPNHLLESNEFWFKAGIRMSGVALLGLSFVSASILGLRNRRRAGWVFLCCAPVVAFCLSFPDVGFLRWEPRGGIFYSPFVSRALGLSFLFFTPFFLPLFLTRQRKRGLLLFVASAVAVSPAFIFSPWTRSLLPRLVGWSALFAIFGLFWMGTDKRDWAPLIATRPRSLRRRLLTALVLCLGIAFLDAAETFALSAWWSSTWTPDCGGRGLFTKPVFSGHSVFTARLVSVGGTSQESVFPRGMVGDWAIGVVQERFWGFPHWSRFVLLTNYIFWKNQTYFIDGRRAEGLLTRYLPIVEAGSCARSRPLVDATLEMRVLHEQFPNNGARIIGYVLKLEPFSQGPTSPQRHEYLAGARITATSSTGRTTAVAVAEGVYQIVGLSPDDYELTLELPDTQISTEGVGRQRTRQNVRKTEFVPGALIERDFHVVWNGTIEGTVRDLAGHPAHPQLQLQNPDGKDLGPVMRYTGGTRDDGSFRFEQVPSGRYVIMVNPDGPGEGWPYSPQSPLSKLGFGLNFLNWAACAGNTVGWEREQGEWCSLVGAAITAGQCESGCCCRLS